ncbi:hypothetical protein AVEN_211411-1 [Araneus ventricosus]|uniref:Uncharacterized protein n=1 Tax=Araneus ventricosus TaxID=182803 RepID=A0A4Y1ZP23_ARAVE|nr:hypothetical protein AVEN_211411-1 [Araneus ventricosus]
MRLSRHSTVLSNRSLKGWAPEPFPRDKLCAWAVIGMDGNGLNPNVLPVQEEASDKKINLVKEEEGPEDLEGSVFVCSKKPDW